MRIAGSALLVLLAVLVPALAQARSNLENERRFVAGFEWIGAHAASGYVAALRCGRGDPGAWRRVVDAVDARYRRCVKPGSALEQAVAQHFARAWQDALADGLSPDGGTVAFERWLSIRERQWGADKASGRCSILFTRVLMEPGSVPGAELEAEYRRHPQFRGDVEMALAIRGLGEDLKWLEEPCDEFFPSK